MTTSSNGGGRGNVGGGRGVAVLASGGIPTTSRKIVQNLKEIVNFPEQEIYAMLKECNMDPSETVHRLLNQDTFHEVKSKREKKKEIKETSDSRSRWVSNSNRVGRGSADRTGRIGSTQLSSKEYGVNRGKSLNKKENGASAIPSSSILTYGMAGNSTNRRSVPSSDNTSMDNTLLPTAAADGMSMSSQSSTGFQHAWLGVPGQLSMADIVKMGRPQAPSNLSAEISYPTHKASVSNTGNVTAKYSTHCDSAIFPSESHHELDSSEASVSRVSEAHKPVIDVGQNISHDGWSLVNASPAGSGSTALETSDANTVYADPSTLSSLHADRVSLHLSSPSDEIRILDGKIIGENLVADDTDVADGEIHLENSGGEASLVDESFENLSSYQSERHAFQHHEVEDVNEEVSSATGNLQQLSLHKEELGARHADNNPAVIISNQLQVTNADCSHLSFGSFGSGISASFSGSFAPKNLKSNLEVASVAADVSSAEPSDSRNPEYYSNEQIRSISNENEAPRANANTGSHDMPLSSQPEVIRSDSTDARHGLQFNEPSAIPGYAFSSTTQPSAEAHTFAQTNSQMQNLASFSTVMQGYSNSLPSDLLASNVQPVREFDVPYSPLLATQSMPIKYSNAVSSISGPTMPETVKPSVLSTHQPTLQNLATTSTPSGPSLPQHLPVLPYTQPTLPLGHFANMISYPLLTPGYTYLPSAAFQQAYTGNSAYHQSPAALHGGGIKYNLPEYKNSVPVTSLPQSAAVASAYGGFANPTNIPGTFALNPSTASARTTIGYDDAISSQFKEGNHYVPLQQTDNSAMWIHGANSRTMPTLPASTYYSFQGQNQHSGFRQSQQQPSHYGGLGYPNFYHSQAGVSQEHQQNTSEGNLNGSQGPPPSQPSHQIWQHSY